MNVSLSEAELAAGRRLMARLDAFAQFTDEPGRLTRLFLSGAHAKAAQAFIGWCAEAGLEARIDAAGNLVARYDGKRAGGRRAARGAGRTARSRNRNCRFRRRGRRPFSDDAHRLARACRRLPES